MNKPIRQIRVEGQLAYVPLTQGRETIIDAADVPLVEGYSWCVSGKYALTRSKHKSVLMHRLLTSALPGLECDHRDGDGLNNRRGNLRIATKAENGQNRGAPKNNKSGAKGVFWNRVTRRWSVRITAHKKSHYVGEFMDIETASDAYAAASERLHGEFARSK